MKGDKKNIWYEQKKPEVSNKYLESLKKINHDEMFHLMYGNWNVDNSIKSLKNKL